jgi:hypothetical protein
MNPMPLRGGMGFFIKGQKMEIQRSSSSENYKAGIQTVTPMTIITKCGYDKGKVFVCVEKIGYGKDEMFQVVLSADDIMKIIESKRGGYQLPKLGGLIG